MKTVIELSKEDFCSPNNILRQISMPINDFGSEFQEELSYLIETFETIPSGVGLSAPQIGIFKRFVIINPLKNTGDKNHLIIVNPTYIQSDTTSSDYNETCLSLPGHRGKVTRNCNILVKYQDGFGIHQELQATDFIGRIFLHEIDHLDGILYVDRMTNAEELFLG